MSWVAVAVGGSAVVGAGTSAILGNQHKGGSPFVSGGADERQYATQDFQDIFGRAPSEAELAQIVPAYVGSDQHIPNKSGGRAYVAQMYNAQQNTPANIYAKQQAQWKAQAPQNYDAVNQITQSALGRKATQEELDHYGTLISSGQADPYQIQQFVQSTPEYQNAQDATFRKGVDTTLQQSDTNFFNTQKGNIAQQYAQMGRATSPALDVALTQLASQLNDSRQNYLAQLSASQYGGNKANAAQGYQNTQNQIQGQINQNTTGIYNQNQALQNRSQQLADYNRQSQDFYGAYGRYGQNGPGALDYLNTGINAGKTGLQAYGAYRSSNPTTQQSLPYGQV